MLDHQRSRDDDRGHQSGAVRGPQPHLDVVALGQGGHHEQAHPPRHLDVHVGRVGQPLVRAVDLRLGHPGALVGDVHVPRAVLGE